MKPRNDLSKKSGSSPTSATETSKPAGGRYLNLDGGKDREGKSMKKDANKQSGSSPTQHGRDTDCPVSGKRSFEPQAPVGNAPNPGSLNHVSHVNPNMSSGSSP